VVIGPFVNALTIVRFRTGGAHEHPFRRSPVRPRQHGWAGCRVRFAFDWAPAPGSYTIETRTSDFGGQSQPIDPIAFNSGGYEFWGVPKFHIDIV
jgi:hypothetical protein